MSHRAKASLFLIFVTVFIDLLGFGIVLPLLPRYGTHFGIHGFTLGALMSSFSLMQFLFAPVWGRISDRIGRRPVLMIGLAGSTIFYALFGVATSLGSDGSLLGLGVVPWLFLTRIGAGVAGATISTAQAYIADVTGAKERSRGMALIGAAFGIGFTFGPLLGAFFVSDDLNAPPSAAPGYIASALSGVAFLFSVFLLGESLNPESKPAGHHWMDLRSLRRAVERPAIGMILLTIFLTTLAFAQFETTLALLTKRLGLPLRGNFYVFAYIGFLLTVFQGGVVRRLLPKLGEFRMAMMGVVFMGLGLLLIGFVAMTASKPLLFAVLPVTVFGFSALTPSLQALLSLRTDESEQGGILGLGQSVSAMSRILGPVLGVSLFDISSTMPYWVAAGIMVIGVGCVATLRRANPAVV